MNTLIFFGSPHKEGATSRLLAAFLSARPADRLIRIDCFVRQPAPCCDCGVCHTAFGCVRHDLDDVYAELSDADILVFATPVYNRSFSAPLKTLIDRLQPYWAARFCRGEKPPIARRKQAFLLTTGDSGREDGAFLEAQLRPTLTVLNATFGGAVHATGCRGDCTAADRAAAEALAQQGW